MGCWKTDIRILFTTSIAVLSLVSAVAEAQDLRGSPTSLDLQQIQARTHDLSSMQNGAKVRRFVASGLLVHLPGNSDYDLHDVSYPYARPAVKLFVERLSSQFRATCGEKLTVTSLTRPQSEQPYNASDQSVHPTGMAVDLRMPESSRCRRWLEDLLLSLENGNVLEATRERNPPHYHVAVFPDPYERYVASLLQSSPQYVVRKGDSLAGIARAMGTTVAALRTENGIQGDLIKPGDSLRIPSGTAETYRVKPGDSLAAIARLFQTTIDALATANNLRGDLILAGQILVVARP